VSAAPVNLDQGPPLPQQLQPQPSAAQLAGPQQGQAQQSGSASLQAQVVQKAMMAEQILNDIATMMPSAAAPISGIIDQMRKGIGMALSQGAQPPPAQGMTGGSGLMSPSGGMGGAPTS
jgi:hypothetical protein